MWRSLGVSEFSGAPDHWSSPRSPADRTDLGRAASSGLEVKVPHHVGPTVAFLGGCGARGTCGMGGEELRCPTRAPARGPLSGYESAHGLSTRLTGTGLVRRGALVTTPCLRLAELCSAQSPALAAAAPAPLIRRPAGDRRRARYITAARGGNGPLGVHHLGSVAMSPRHPIGPGAMP
jgi:hypothetical protein